MKKITITCSTLLLFFISFISSSLAEELSITVLQKGTGDPVQDATVVFKGNAQHSLTSAQGVAVFSLLKPVSKQKFDDLKVLSQGYKTLDIRITPNPENITVYLTPNLVELEGLEVVEARVVEKASKVVLSGSELRKAPGSMGDPIKVLQSLPGVVSAGGSSAGQVYMRGSDVQESVYWINNLPVGYLYHWGGLNSVVNPALVSDFNIFLGGFPVEYGDFLGGAVDVKLRAPKKDRIHTNLHLGTYESSFLVEGPLGEANDDNSFYLAARRSYIDLLFSPDAFSKANSKDSKNTFILVPQFSDMQALYRHETNQGSFDIQYFAAEDKLELVLNDAAITDPEAAGDLRIHQKSKTLGFNWENQWSNTFSQHVTAGMVDSSNKLQVGTDPYGDPYFTNVKSRQYFIRPIWQSQQENRTTTFGLDLGRTELPLELYIALPEVNTTPNPGGFTSQPKYKVKKDITATGYSPFIKYQQQWGSLKTSLGLRYTSWWANQGSATGDIKMSGISPRLSAEYQLNENTLFLLRWGDYFQEPRGYQMLDEFGNPKLSYTRAEHRILGIEQKLDNIWSLKVEAYHKPMTDLVVGIEGVSPPNNFRNQGEGVAYGVDVFLKRKQEDRKMGWLSYSWAKSKRKDLNTGVTTSFVGNQPHTITAVWGQPFTGSWSEWDWGIKLQLHSGLPYTPVIGRVQEAGTGRWLPIYADYNSATLPAYGKLDVRFSKQVLYDTWKISYVFDIQNISMRKNVSGYDYNDDFSNYTNPNVVSTDVFLPFFGIEAEF